MAYDSKFKRDDIDALFEAILSLEDEEDCYRFFEDLCNIRKGLCRRFHFRLAVRADRKPAVYAIWRSA